LYYPDNSPEEQSNIHRSIKRSANWFFGLAILSAANTLFLLYLGTTFAIGFGVTSVTVVFAQRQGTTATVLVSLVTLVSVVLYIVLGIFGRRRYKWAFTTGLFVYAIDGLFLILVQDWYSIALHCLLLYLIFQGMSATSLYNKLWPR
jgi:uncharacterized membrane protein